MRGGHESEGVEKGGCGRGGGYGLGGRQALCPQPDSAAVFVPGIQDTTLSKVL